MFQIEVDHVFKYFNRRPVLEDLAINIVSGMPLTITGPNGSGKTTLVRIICGLIGPTRGAVTVRHNDRVLSMEEFHRHLGLVGPYLNLYKDLTAMENLVFFATARQGKANRQRIRDLMNRVGLSGRENDRLSGYSSGMLQRIKYAAALYHDPAVLILDEPTSNLDKAGSEIVYNMIAEASHDKLLIIATNEPEELRFGQQHLDLAR